MSDPVFVWVAIGALALLAAIAALAAAVLANVRRLERDVKLELSGARSEQAAAAQGARMELVTTLGQFGQRLDTLTQSNHERLEAVRSTVEQRLDVLRNENAKKLDEMRATVDERLQSTLETRLGESFKLVSERLEQVHKGLGEMQALATGVGDLKRVLSSVKSRGLWGEVQLGALLADVLTPAQYEQNVETRPGSRQRVEYAVRFPGRSQDGAPLWLPIDCKFPLDDWQRLQDAIERADSVAVDACRKALDQFFKSQAKDIRDKYIAPPHTTDFAILFVPTEGLYAEAMAHAGLVDVLQREYRVAIAGPTTLWALLSSFQHGFRTLAIEQRSAEVWRVLGAVKTDFGRFAEILSKTQRKLQEASNTIDEARGKSTTIVRKLRDVEALPHDEADRLLAGESVPLVDAVPAADAPSLLDGLVPDELQLAPSDVK